MTKLENHIAEAGRIQSDTDGRRDSKSNVEPSTIQSGLSGWDLQELWHFLPSAFACVIRSSVDMLSLCELPISCGKHIVVAGNPHIKCREQEDTHHQCCYQTTDNNDCVPSAKSFILISTPVLGETDYPVCSSLRQCPK
jgi:hypothetical protein